MTNQPVTYDQLRKHRYVLFVLVLALVVIVVGIFVELVQSRRTSQIDIQLKRLARPLDPTFNNQVFERLAAYEYLSPEEVRQQIEVLPVRILDKDSDTIRELDQLQSGESPTATSSAQPGEGNDELEESSLPPSSEAFTPTSLESATDSSPESAPDESPDTPPDTSTQPTSPEGTE